MTCGVALLLHAFTCGYMLCFSATYGIMPPDEAKVLRIWSPGVCAGVCGLLALLHAHGVAMIVYRQSRRVAPSPKPRRPSTLALYAQLFAHDGAFGIHGRQYEVRLVVKQALQLPLQAYRAYRLSALLVHPGYSVAFASTLAINCIALPGWMWRGHWQRSRRWGASIVDVVASFLLGVGLPLLIVGNAIVAFFFSSQRDALIYDHKWLNTFILIGRYVAITSAADLMVYTILNVAFWTALQTLAMASSRSLMVSVPTEMTTHWLRLPYTIYSVGLGILVLGASISSIVARATCDAGCELQTYPWFSTDCHCIMYTLTCNQTTNVSSSDNIHALLATNFTDVFDLTIRECRLPHGLNASLLDTFTQLYSLRLWRTSTVEWDAPTLPSSVCAVYLQDLPLQAVPRLLWPPTTGLQYIFLRNASLSMNQTLPLWTTLTQLDVSGAQLGAIPDHIWSLPITTLSWNSNALTALPLQLFNVPTLGSVYLFNNSITELPPMLATTFWPKGLQSIYLNGNPLTTLPSTLPFEWLNSSRLVIRDTLFCTRLAGRPPTNTLEVNIVANMEAICGHDCGVGCLGRLVGNTECDNQCNTPACAFDGGDCDM
ncbi:hypothetical protein SDRG_15983 [Saprolegnia diclina VS20]|uniref:LNR domain-containing protein n=1 Tax=Saprolegnia diclina (strain VS20) TaxID=1156394 RepID=T0PLB5_SAPDV|nr:hypothetical protein SDRG_15983 [Saprolegnia diclina VS20]EQC26179.1 hypothetical protein SDRG_15983 [Saprolegnia diclina VS20]|eukprot:XP_008620394.1 hypothetical protein SDRG_15983 [Saprolegnia diclina VS20]